jgi:glutamate-1-semialdehyde aminotransferase
VVVYHDGVVGKIAAQSQRRNRLDAVRLAAAQAGIDLAPSQFQAAFVSAAHTEDDIRETVAAAGEAFTGICSAPRVAL